MNLLFKGLFLCLCLSTISCFPFQKDPTLEELRKTFETDELNTNGLEATKDQLKITNVLKESTQTLQVNQTRNETELNRTKRQLAAPLGFRSYDYGDYYGGLTGDYNYDYYDWVCSETRCQLCNILGGECCDPDANPNCFLPDSCLNNPCLAGGSCVTTQTIDGRPDFLCICLPGLTGKYCQITNDYIVDGWLPRIPIGPAFPPHGPFPTPSQPMPPPPPNQMQPQSLFLPPPPPPSNQMQPQSLFLPPPPSQGQFPPAPFQQPPPGFIPDGQFMG